MQCKVSKKGTLDIAALEVSHYFHSSSTLKKQKLAKKNLKKDIRVDIHIPVECGGNSVYEVDLLWLTLNFRNLKQFLFKNKPLFETFSFFFPAAV